MSKTKRSHQQHEGLDNDGANHGFHRPYWKHAHHDWRLIVAVSLMLMAVFIYVMSDDLTLWPRGQRQQTPASAVAK